MRLARPLENLIDHLVKLPTIGPKTAQRLALFILRLSPSEASDLARAIGEVQEKVKACSNCGFLTEEDPCDICCDRGRDRDLLCIVEDSSNVIAIEKSGFRGYYYVLNKQQSLLEGGGLEDIDRPGLEKYLRQGRFKEVIMALNPDIDGEIMARFLASMIQAYGIKTSRLAHGLPVGGDIEFTDEVTLRRAIEGRREI